MSQNYPRRPCVFYHFSGIKCPSAQLSSGWWQRSSSEILLKFPSPISHPSSRAWFAALLHSCVERLSALKSLCFGRGPRLFTLVKALGLILSLCSNHLETTRFSFSGKKHTHTLSLSPFLSLSYFSLDSISLAFVHLEKHTHTHMAVWSISQNHKWKAKIPWANGWSQSDYE